MTPDRPSMRQRASMHQSASMRQRASMHQSASMHRTASTRRTVAVALAVGGAMIAAGAFVPLQSWVHFFSHPLRTERLGHVAPTTLRGAEAWRAALVAGGVLAPLLVGAIAALTRGAPAARPDRPAIDTRTSRRALAGLSALIAIGVVVRAPRLLESLWYDEIAAFLDFSQFGPGPTMGNYFTQSNHILQGMLSWLAASIGGVDELTLRLPTFLASLATIPAALALGREVLDQAEPPAPPRRPTLASLPWLLAGFSTLAPIGVLEAVEARGYAFMILFSTLATMLFLRGVRRPSTPLWTAYAAIVALGAWSHLVTICVALGHGAIVAALLLRTETRRAALAAAAALLLAATLTVVLYAPALPDMLSIRREFRALDGDEPTLLGPEGLHAALSIGGAWYAWSAAPALLLAAVGAWGCARDARLRMAALAALAGAPVAIGLAWLGDSWLYARFLLFALPGAALLVATGVATLASRSRFAAVAVTAIAVAAWSTDLVVRPSKQPLRDAVREVAAARSGSTAGDSVATVGLADNVIAWYGVAGGIDIVPTGPLGRDLAAVLEHRHPRWVVLLYPRSVPADRFAALERAGFTLRTRHAGWVDWDNGDVLVYERAATR